MDINVLKTLEAKTASVAWERDNRKVWYVLFSISGFTKELTEAAAGREDVLLCES